MAVPKKRISMSKKHICKNIWKKKKEDLATVKAFSLSKSISIGRSKSFFVQQINNKVVELTNPEKIVKYFKIND